MLKQKLGREWSVTDLDRLFKEAATTLHRLPAVIRKKQYSNAWPDYVNGWSRQAEANVGGWEAKIRIQPTTEDVTRLEFALEVGWEMEREDRVMIWYTVQSCIGRERGPRWKFLSKRFSCDSRTVKAKYEKALIKAYYLLKGLQS